MPGTHLLAGNLDLLDEIRSAFCTASLVVVGTNLPDRPCHLPVRGSVSRFASIRQYTFFSIDKLGNNGQPGNHPSCQGL